MHRLPFIVSVIVTMFVLGCAEKYVARVSLNHALTQYGRVNSKDYELGEVLIWNRHLNSVERFPNIPRQDIPIRRIPPEGTQDEVAIGGFSEGDIQIQAKSPKVTLTDEVKVSIGTAIGKQTSLKLSSYAIETYNGRFRLPNDPNTFAWRITKLSDEYLSPDVIFVIVTEVLSASNASFYSGTPEDSAGKPKSFTSGIEVGDIGMVRVSYAGGETMRKAGAKIPSIVKYEYYRLTRNTAGATDYRFEKIDDKDIDKRFAETLRGS